VWEADEERAREVRSGARRAAAKAKRHLVAARDEHRGAVANIGAGHRKKSIRDHDATNMLRQTLIGWAEDRLGRRVEVARRAAERALEAIPEAPSEHALGRSIFVDYERCPRRFLFELDTPAIAAGDHVVLRDVRVAVRASDRIRIAGDNGAGKTTLLAALVASSTLPADRVLALPQELDDDTIATLVADTTALPPATRGRVLSIVAALGVDPDRLLASAAPSPGEGRKLALALGLGRHAWCVVLDEPTNHLDLPSIERLEDALAAYPGAIVLVSHDDRFAARCTGQTWQVRDGGVTCE
jgi:ATPase subunit of ABC transporter with duplicated ATPase domains